MESNFQVRMRFLESKGPCSHTRCHNSEGVVVEICIHKYQSYQCQCQCTEYAIVSLLVSYLVYCELVCLCACFCILAVCFLLPFGHLGVRSLEWDPICGWRPSIYVWSYTLAARVGGRPKIRVTGGVRTPRRVFEQLLEEVIYF